MSESGEESNEESEEKDDLDNEALHIQRNLMELESEERSHSFDLLEYSYTRLPCAAHKVCKIGLPADFADFPEEAARLCQFMVHLRPGDDQKAQEHSQRHGLVSKERHPV